MFVIKDQQSVFLTSYLKNKTKLTVTETPISALKVFIGFLYNKQLFEIKTKLSKGSMVFAFSLLLYNYISATTELH